MVGGAIAHPAVNPEARIIVSSFESPPNTAWSRRPPLRFNESCHANGGAGDSSGSCQRRRVGAAHTDRWAAEKKYLEDLCQKSNLLDML